MDDQPETSQQSEVTESAAPVQGPLPPPGFTSHSLTSHRHHQVAAGSDDGQDDYDDAYGTAAPGDPTRDQQRGLSFFPPLWLARRLACLQRLKAENIRTVADLGCGKGAVLAMLVHPAWHRDDFPELYPPLPDDDVAATESQALRGGAEEHATTQQSYEDKMRVLRRVQRLRPEDNELHLSRVIGVDLDPEECKLAKKVIDPARCSSQVQRDPRWEDLHVELYEGGIEVFNDALQEVEAIILTEVVEHLSEPALAKLPSVLFDLYSPRLVIVTTPNHAFNPYFPASKRTSEDTSDSPEREEGGHLFPDSTGRTNRVFRDPTHTLEWTPEEFRSWCDELIATHASDYKATIGGVGSLKGYYRSSEIPFPPPSLDLHPALADHPACTSVPSDPEHFYATQMAVFERQYSGEAERSPRSARPTPLPFFSPSSAPTSLPVSPDSSVAALPPLAPKQHRLVYAGLHHADPSTRHEPASPVDVLDAVEAVFLSARTGDELSLKNLWRIGGDGEIGLTGLAQGQVGRIVDALVGGSTLSPPPPPVAAEDEKEDGEREVDRFVLSVDPGQAGMAALRVRWLDYDAGVHARLVQAEQDASTSFDDTGDGRDGRLLPDSTDRDEELADWTNEEGVLALDDGPTEQSASMSSEQPAPIEPPATWDQQTPTVYGPVPPPPPAPSARASWTEPLDLQAEGSDSKAAPALIEWDEDEW